MQTPDSESFDTFGYEGSEHRPNLTFTNQVLRVTPVAALQAQAEKQRCSALYPKSELEWLVAC